MHPVHAGKDRRHGRLRDDLPGGHKQNYICFTYVDTYIYIYIYRERERSIDVFTLHICIHIHIYTYNYMYTSVYHYTNTCVIYVYIVLHAYVYIYIIMYNVIARTFRGAQAPRSSIKKLDRGVAT